MRKIWPKNANTVLPANFDHKTAHISKKSKETAKFGQKLPPFSLGDV
jgi:hypothetical protein